MKGLRKIDSLILKLINDLMPNGTTPSLIAIDLKISPQNLNRYLRKLEKRGYIRRRKMGIQTYYFTINASTQGQPKPFTPTQRPHAIRASAKLYASSASRAKESLEARGLSGKPIMKGSGLVVAWRGIILTLFKNGRLEMHPSLPEYPLNVPLEPILQKAAHEAGIWIEAFLSETGMRAIRDRLGRLAMEITYWENGYPRNEVAKQTTEPGEKKVYAYDRKTGKEAIWADNSLNPFTELETNSPRADMVIKKMMQAHLNILKLN